MHLANHFSMRPTSGPAAPPQPAAARSGVARLVPVVLGLWLAAVFLLGARGAFVRPPGAPPLPILLGATAPLLAFLAAFVASRGLRAYVLAVDLRLITAVQAWRFAGLGFLALYAQGALPGPFAWPAGLGDIAIGVTAPWVMLALIRRPGFAAGSGFRVWNWLGIADLVVAVGTGGLTAWLAGAGEVTTAPMARLPLVLIPAYLVPVFVLLHAVALIQARRPAVSGGHGGPVGEVPAWQGGEA